MDVMMVRFSPGFPIRWRRLLTISGEGIGNASISVTSAEFGDKGDMYFSGRMMWLAVITGGKVRARNVKTGILPSGRCSWTLCGRVDIDGC